MNTVFQANGNRAQRLSLPLGAVPMPPAPAARGLRLTTVLSCILWCYARSMWEHSRHRLTKDDLLFFVIAVVLILFDRATAWIALGLDMQSSTPRRLSRLVRSRVIAWTAEALSEEGGKRFDPRRAWSPRRHDEVQCDRRRPPVGHDRLEPPFRQGLADDEIRLHGKAKTGEQRRCEGIGVIGPQGSGRSQCHFLTGGVHKPPNVWGQQIGVAEAVMMAEVLRMGRASMALEIVGRGDEEAVHPAEPPGKQGGIRQGANAQGGVESGADQIDHRIAQMQVDRDFRTFREEVRQERRDLAETKGHGGGQTHEPARARRLSQSFALRCFTFGENAGGAVRQEPAGIGQRKPARGPVEEPRAQPLLQPADRFGNRGLGESEILGRPNKRAKLCYLGEDRKPFEVRQLGHRSETMSF